MSFPDIPGVDLYKDMSRDDAINLMLASIALEEMGLAKLLNAESEKAEAILDMKKSQHETRHIIDINRSIDKTIQNITNLHIILKSKLDNILDLCPATNSEAAKTPTGSFTAGNGSIANVSTNIGSNIGSNMGSNMGSDKDPHTPAYNSISTSLYPDSTISAPGMVPATSPIGMAPPISSSGKISDTTATITEKTDLSSDAAVNITPSAAENKTEQSRFSLVGSSKISITNKDDSLYKGDAIIETNILQSTNLKKVKLKYVVQKTDKDNKQTEYMTAVAQTLNIHYLTPYSTGASLENPKIRVIRGNGWAVKEDLEDGVVEGDTSFILYIADTGSLELIKMVLLSPKSKLNHDSGLSKVLTGRLVISES